MPSPHGEAIAATATFVVTALAAAFVVGVIASRLRFPYTVALLIASLPLTVSGLHLKFTSIVLWVFVPALVFEAAWNLRLRILRRMWLPVSLLAAGGVFLTAFAVGGGVALAKLLPFKEALVLGAILAATDPIAVIAVFRRIAIPAELATIIEGESLFNDGIAVVLYGATVSLAAAPSSTIAPTAWSVVVGMVLVSLGGAALGFVTAAIIARFVLLLAPGEYELQVLASIVCAYGAYVLGGRMGVSGLFASVVGGMALRGFEHFPTDDASTEAIDRFWGLLAFLANALVFVLLGLVIDPRRLVHEPSLVVLTLALVLIARAALVYGLLPPLKLSGAWRGIILVAGIRGALSVALALALPSDFPHREQIVDGVFGVVVITLIVQGLAIEPLAKRFGT